MITNPKTRTAAAIVAVALIATACSSGPAAAPSPSPSETPPPPPKAPLTGLEVASGDIESRPIVGVKIDNHVRARPPVGLDKADVVYEEPVEGGLTRFLALFQSHDVPTVGPIRSARFADIELLADYGKPILAYSGAAGVVQKALQASPIVLVPHGPNGAIYRRMRSRPAPHNLFSATAALRKRAKGASDPRSLWTFGDLPSPPGAGASPSPSPSPAGSPDASPIPSPAWPSGVRARVPFSSGSFTAVWTYDEETKRYERSQGGKARTADGTRLTARNVLVLSVKPGSSSRKAIDMSGSGKAVLLRDGVRITGKWSRADRGRTIFTDSEGRPFIFAPGNTWVEIAPTRIKPTYR